jgi:hypothetical protein
MASASADELVQVANTLLQMADHIQRKRKIEDLVMATNTEFTRVVKEARTRDQEEKHKHASLSSDKTAPSGSDDQTIAVPRHEWKKIMLHYNKMIHLIYHQKNLLQTFLPGQSDAQVVVMAMTACTCPKEHQ